MAAPVTTAPERRVIPKGTVIFREGDKGTDAFMVQQGAVRIFKSVAGKRVTLGVCKPFQIFGELALMDDSPRMAAAEAVEDTTVLVVSGATIRQMLNLAPAGLSNVLNSLISTMRVMGDELAVARAQIEDSARRT